MNWAWATSLEQLWRSPTFPMWLTLAAAVFFGIIALVTLLRAEKSVANGALTVITLLAISVAATATIRGFGTGDRSGPAQATAVQPAAALLPALACVDDMAGEAVLAACEKLLFGSADSVAAAVSYAAGRIDQLGAAGAVAAADKKMTAPLMALRRAMERDRYGLVAYVLQSRDRCQSASCAVYASLTDHNQIAANMEEHTYEGLITRYSPSWNAAPAAPGSPAPGLTALPGAGASVPTGKPTTAEFPTSASIPPINIMTPEPPLSPQRPVPAPAASAPAAAPRPAAPAAPAAKKPPAPKQARAPVQTAPVQLAPAAADPDN